MSVDSDVAMWKQLASWLWAVLAVPLGILWKKVDAAMTKQEFKDYILEARLDRKEIKDTVERLFDKIDSLQRDQHKQTIELIEALNHKADKK